MVSAIGVVGMPTWGTRYGAEASSFDGSATCVVGAKVKSCALAPPGDPVRSTLPAGCTVYLADAAGPGCNTSVKRCIPSSEPPACAILPASNIWNRDVSMLPVHAMSDARVATIGVGSPLHPDFGAPYHGRASGIPYVNVGATQPPVPVSLTAADESDPGPYPIPPLVPVEGGGPVPSKGRGDAHVLLVQQDTCTLYETFAAARWRMPAVSNLDRSGTSPEGSPCAAATCRVASTLVRPSAQSSRTTPVARS